MKKYEKWIEASPDEPVVDVAARSLRSRFDPVLHYFPLAAERSAEDVEYVHQVRVWSRRTLACTDLYRGLLPKWRTQWIERKMKKIRRATNDARDADVFALRLKQDKKKAGVDRLLAKVGDHRCDAQRPILKAYRKMVEDGKLPKRTRKLVARIRLKADEDKKHQDFGTWAVRRIQPEFQVFLDAAGHDLTKADNLHCFRVKGKKIRYALELMSAAFPAAFRDEFYPLLTEFQDRLGEINDHATAHKRLAHWCESDDDREEAKYLRKAMKEELAFFEERRDEFLAWWADGRKDKFRETMAGLAVAK